MAEHVERLSVVIGGHVDHGKSTVVGRLLADSGALPDGKIESIRQACERSSRPFEYAFLLDALKDERGQGITIDAARIFFRTKVREYVVLDAPGHVEFLKNMVTGASQADAALLVVDAAEGLKENSRRHAYLLGMLGVTQLAVAVNKMDLVGFERSRFDSLAGELGALFAKLNLPAATFIPVSGREGDNLSSRSARTGWYEGPTVVEAFDRFAARPRPKGAAFRMPVQDVYKFTARGDTRRIVAGTVESGELTPGDEVIFHPSGKRTRVKTLEGFPDSPPSPASAGDALGVTLAEEVYVQRGEVMAKVSEPAPRSASRVKASLLWLGKAELQPGREYPLRVGTALTRARVEKIDVSLDASDLSRRDAPSSVRRNEVASVELSFERPIAFDLDPALPATSRFVLFDDHRIQGGGRIQEALASPHAESGALSRLSAPRSGTVVVVSGGDGTREAVRRLETTLRDHGLFVHAVELPPGPNRDAAWSSLVALALPLCEAGAVVLAGVQGMSAGESERISERLPEGALLTVELSENGAEAQVLSRLAASGRHVRPAVIWFTGLSGAGKSTLSERLVELLRARGRKVEHLDGDAVRDVFPATGFSRPERDSHIRRVGFLASRLEAHGVTVVSSFVSPYADSRAFVRSLCRRFIEVHVATPLEECERRDPKGLYARARSGKLPNFTGVDDPYEAPERPELRIDTTGESVEGAVAKVLAALDGGAP